MFLEMYTVSKRQNKKRNIVQEMYKVNNNKTCQDQNDVSRQYENNNNNTSI